MDKYPNTNLEILKPSRKRPTSGDVFAIKIKGADGYFWGIVGSNDVKVNRSLPPDPRLLLVYIFNVSTVTLDPPKDLEHRTLLIPPMVVNLHGWSRGYFQTIDKVDESKLKNLLTNTIFYSHSFNEYCDLSGKQYVPGINNIIVERGVGNYRIVDDKVSLALGIPLAPD